MISLNLDSDFLDSIFRINSFPSLTSSTDYNLEKHLYNNNYQIPPPLIEKPETGNDINLLFNVDSTTFLSSNFEEKSNSITLVENEEEILGNNIKKQNISLRM